MSEQTGTTLPQVDETTSSSTTSADKGKGKAPATEQDVSMGEEEDSSDESGVEEPVSNSLSHN